MTKYLLVLAVVASLSFSATAVGVAPFSWLDIPNGMVNWAARSNGSDIYLHHPSGNFKTYVSGAVANDGSVDLISGLLPNGGFPNGGDNVVGGTNMVRYVSNEDGSYKSGDYIQISLGADLPGVFPRWINNVTALFRTTDYAYPATAFNVYVSMDGEYWQQVVADVLYNESGAAFLQNTVAYHYTDFSTIAHSDPIYKTNGLVYEFAPVQANYIRITDMRQSGLAWYASQILVIGPAVPEPATMSLLALGGLALLRRRRR